LKYVQDAFGTDHPDPDAMNAWNDNYGSGNHTSLPPAGKTVPVYFSLGNVPQGHVAISLDDGKIASSTRAGTFPQGYIHPNLNDLIAVYGKYNGGCTYLGWSEYVGTVHVVEWSNPNATAEQVQQAYRDILERPADPGGLAHYAFNYTNDFVRADLMKSEERKLLLANKAAAAQAAQDAVAKAAAEAIRLKELEAKALADKLALEAENARLEAERKAKELADAQAEKDKVVADNNAFILWLKNIFEVISKWLTSWRK
jgi:hypothetical protein